MGIFEFFAIVVVIGVVVYAIHRWVPMPDAFKTVILIAGIILVVWILLAALGLLPTKDYQIPRLGGS